MRLKVFIAEDEEWIRMGIKKMIRWEQLGLELAGEAEDGQIALEMILELKPDIILTDIRMPSMDGLTMSEEVGKALKKAKFIFISGYRDFDYVKGALRLGVVDYVLKPVDEDELNNVLKKTVELISEEEEKQKSDKYLRNSFILDLVEEKLNEEDITFFKKSIGGYDGSDRFYTVALARCVSMDENFDAFFDKLEKVVAREFFPGINTTVVRKEKNEGVLIIASNAAEADIGTYLRRIDEKIDFKSLNGMVVIGKTVQYIREIPVSYNTAKEAFEHRAINSPVIMNYRDIEKSRTSISLSGIANELRMALELCDMKLISGLVDRLFADLQNARGVTLKNIVDSIVSLAFNYIRLIHEREIYSGVYYDRCYGFLREFSDKMNINELKGWFLELLRDMTEDIQESKRKSVDLAVKQVMDYIDVHYNEDVHLNSVAAMVYMNPAYLSSAFKKIAGENFIDYLIRKRIEKAKELLMERDVSINETARLVGYDNVRHFSNLFKKYTGCKPSEYRRQGNYGKNNSSNEK